NFRPFKDNILISWNHTRLFFGMLPRIPQLLRRRFKANDRNKWFNIKEVGSLFGMKILLAIYAVLGRNILKILLHLVVGYYYLFNSRARDASRTYFSKLSSFQKNQSQKAFYSSYRHIYSFAEMMLDKFAVWRNDITLKDLDFPDQALLH